MFLLEEMRIGGDFSSALFKPVAWQLYSRMAGEPIAASLQVLFGKAFLIELRRGDVATARVFARAFLLRTLSLSTYPSVKLHAAA